MKRPPQSTTSSPILWGYILHLEKSQPFALEESKPKNKAKGTLDECVCYAVSRQLPATDGEWFYDRMETVGWLLGKAKVADWQACMRTWQRECYFPSLKQNFRGSVQVTTQWQPPTGM